MTINFAAETIEKLKFYNYTIEDISWIGNRAFTISVYEFFDAARKTNYNNSYGTAYMPADLLIVMKDGSYFERAEYDGSEWWRYVPIVEKPFLHTHLKTKDFLDSGTNWETTLQDFVVRKERK